MADRIRWDIRAIPIETCDEGGDHIHSDVGKSYGASSELDASIVNASETKSIVFTAAALGSGTSAFTFCYFENLKDSIDSIKISLDSGATYPLLLGVGEAVVLHVSGIAAEDIYLRTPSPNDTATMRYLVDNEIHAS